MATAKSSELELARACQPIFLCVTDAYELGVTLVRVFINRDKLCLPGFQFRSLKPVFTDMASQGDFSQC